MQLPTRHDQGETGGCTAHVRTLPRTMPQADSRTRLSLPPQFACLEGRAGDYPLLIELTSLREQNLLRDKLKVIASGNSA